MCFLLLRSYASKILKLFPSRCCVRPSLITAAVRTCNLKWWIRCTRYLSVCCFLWAASIKRLFCQLSRTINVPNFPSCCQVSHWRYFSSNTVYVTVHISRLANVQDSKFVRVFFLGINIFRPWYLEHLWSSWIFCVSTRPSKSFRCLLPLSLLLNCNITDKATFKKRKTNIFDLLHISKWQCWLVSMYVLTKDPRV